MPRSARNKSVTGIYHVILRGINKQTIFFDDEDMRKFLFCLADCQIKSGFVLHAYCLMDNHVHLLLGEGSQIENESLEVIFKRIGVRFAKWYNNKYERSGHLFQDRFKSQPVADERQYLTVLRYIYQNPLKAGLCARAEDYRWSSLGSLGKKINPGSSCPVVTHQLALTLCQESKLREFINYPNDDFVMDIENCSRKKDTEALQFVQQLCGIKNPTEFTGLKKENQGSILQLLCRNNCTVRQLSRILGISEYRIRRLLASGDGS